ncbi:MAG: thiamine-monophosphate kinase [Candidatus Omnitrophica bacterium]|nr:thiamine-monophosphate kinase [Candidatus Omnitrophota bacterium]
MNELAWIDYLRGKVKPAKDLLVGIGDDCAVIKAGNQKLLLKSDLFIDQVHFSRGKISFENIGKRAVARVLSDFAACGGKPKFIGVSLGAPKGLGEKYLKQILNGILKSSKQYKFSLVGGDTSNSKQLILDVWGVGSCKKPILRSGAKIGDYIFITSKLGQRPFNQPFTPRLEESQYLVKGFKVNSMIDISDGFILDLYRILKLSKKGAILDKKSIPTTKGAGDFYRGEDYELIFTIDRGETEKNINCLKKKFHCVGKVSSVAAGYKFRDNNKISKIEVKGYTHS